MLVVRLAGLMVPRAERREWTAEWAGELWQVQRAGSRQADAVGFSLGAVRDALLIRSNRCAGRARALFTRESATGCIAILGAIALSGVLVCLALPGARATLLPLPYRQAGNLALISRFNAVGRELPSIQLSEYREWTANTASLYQQLAYYTPETSTLRFWHRRPASLVVAVASANLLDVLQLRDPGVAPGFRNRVSGPLLLLTQSAWARWYLSDPSLLGCVAQLRGQQVTLAGVMPDGDWRLPVHADAVLLEDSQGSEQLPATLNGFVVARVRPSAFRASRGELHSMVETRDGAVLYYACLSLSDIRSAPAQAFACCVGLALLALPVIAALSLGDYPIAREALRPGLVVRRWLFVAAKFLLVAAIIAAWSAAIAFGAGSQDLLSAISHQPSGPDRLHPASLWLPLGPPRSAPALSGLHAQALSPSPRRPAVMELPRMVRDRDDLLPRSWPPAYPRTANQLVWHSALAGARSLVARPV
jgi:hypothetical protein